VRSGSEHIIVDGMNVIGSRPDGWWRDRDGAARRLLARLQHLARDRGPQVTLVLDGRPLSDLPAGQYDGVEVTYARRAGRDAGDDRLVEVLRALRDQSGVSVVTSDRGLAARVQQLGVSVHGARSLLERLDALDG
jgi:predicted RNA-binding protein with PIN domain